MQPHGLTQVWCADISTKNNSTEERMQGITKQTYSHQITEYIKERILAGEFAPGDKVNEVLLASRLSISRAPIREALQLLVQEGLIVSTPQRGKSIATLTSKEIRNSYFTGGVLEGAAAASTIHMFTDDDFARLKAVVDSMADCVARDGDMDELATLDTAFHDVIFSRTDNQLLVELSRRACQGISKFLLFRYWRTAFTPEEVLRRHKVVLEAMLTRDPVFIESAIRNHYVDSGRRMARWGTDMMPHP